MKISKVSFEASRRSLFVTLLLFCAFYQGVIGAKLKTKLRVTTSRGSVYVAQSNLASEYFFIQKFYPGKEPELIFDKSEVISKRKYLKLTEQMIYYTTSETTSDILEDQFDLADIYDPKVDNASKGKCCGNLKYLEFPIVTKCDGEYCTKESLGNDGGSAEVANTSKNSVIQMNPLLARFCLDIDVYSAIHWRICHNNKEDINKLRSVMVYQIIKLYQKVLDSKLIEKLLTTNDTSPVVAPSDWNWMDEKKWGGYCDIKQMQSPISIDTSAETTIVQNNFRFSYNFSSKVEFKVLVHGEELVINFLYPEKCGLFTLEFGDSLFTRKVSFYPTGMYFRFRAEHVIDTKRYDGEFVFTFKQVTVGNDEKLKVVESLNWTIPLYFSPEGLEIPDLDNLMADFWRFELMYKTVYFPKDYKTKEVKTFDLGNFFKHIAKLKSHAALYLGSETTPPCKEGVLHLINISPLTLNNCQFKVFQDNSLTSSRSTEIHARTLQINTSRPVIRYVKWNLVPEIPKETDYELPDCELERPASSNL